MKISQYIKLLMETGYTKEQIDAALESAKVLTADMESEMTLATQNAVKMALMEKELNASKGEVNELREKLETITVRPGESLYKESKVMYNPATKKIERLSAEQIKMTSGLHNLMKAIACNRIADADKIHHDLMQEFGLATQRSDSSSVGGYAVPTQYSDEIISHVRQQSPFMSRTSGQTVMSNGKVYTIMYGGAVAGRANQDTAASETNATLAQTTLIPKLLAGFTPISLTLIRENVNFVPLLMQRYQASVGTACDLYLVTGSVSGNSDPINGLTNDTNLHKPTAVALGDVSFSTLEDLIDGLDETAQNIVFMGNRKLYRKIGNLKFDDGDRMFPEYYQTGAISPQGHEFIVNTQIGNALVSGLATRTGGTSSVLFAFDPSMVYTYLGDIRISQIPIAQKEQISFEMYTDFGVLLPSASASGKYCSALEITGCS